MTKNNKPISNNDVFAQRPSSAPEARVKRFPIWTLALIPGVLALSIFAYVYYIGDNPTDKPYDYVTQTCNRFENQTIVKPFDARLKSSELDVQIHAVHYNIPQDMAESNKCNKATLVEMTVRNISDDEFFSETNLYRIHLLDGEEERTNKLSKLGFDDYIKKNSIVFLDKKITAEQQRGWLLFESDHLSTDQSLTLTIPGDVVDGHSASLNISNG